MFSIIIPTLNNLKYLKLCIKSIKKNSHFNHQIIPHVNIGEDGTIDYLQKENIEYTFTKYNAGICEGMNMASKKTMLDHQYILGKKVFLDIRENCCKIDIDTLHDLKIARSYYNLELISDNSDTLKSFVSKTKSLEKTVAKHS